MKATPGDGVLLTKKSLSLEDAKKIAAGAAAEALKNKWNLDIAVVDDGGHLIYFERTDGTLLASADLAIGKARTAVAFQRPTKALEDALNSGEDRGWDRCKRLQALGGRPSCQGGSRRVHEVVGHSAGCAGYSFLLRRTPGLNLEIVNESAIVYEVTKPAASRTSKMTAMV
jgi:glc operon protein GlcG